MFAVHGSVSKSNYNQIERNRRGQYLQYNAWNWPHCCSAPQLSPLAVSWVLPEPHLPLPDQSCLPPLLDFAFPQPSFFSCHAKSCGLHPLRVGSARLAELEGRPEAKEESKNNLYHDKVNYHIREEVETRDIRDTWVGGGC